MRFLKPFAATGLAAALVATSLVGSAEAGSRHRDAFFAGAAGFAAGAFLGSIARPHYPYAYYDDDYPGYYYHRPGYYYDDAPVYYYDRAPRAYYEPRVYYDEPTYRYRGSERSSVCSTPGSKPAWAMC